MRPSGAPGLKRYAPTDKSYTKWKEYKLSGKEIAVEDLKVADLDGDGVVGPQDLAVLLGSYGPCD